jgi:hypothetical protein
LEFFTKSFRDGSVLTMSLAKFHQEKKNTGPTSTKFTAFDGECPSKGGEVICYMGGLGIRG